ncbi:TM2 domain-containing protein [Brevibacillus laterosporus]|uniref:TM2 domain-containing protein n=1 Tax=Brevibacillus laterosporus TaxID=1465 RepID=UPI0026540348|nr:TM2 domain-containing protein [Brevibacillus laterosporus]MDN9008503.1 TM2 domain-containing protein [Brevibacillus laterosporus]MDO0939588.1 TM2 domain-containing protein [Brevibacillus laterosporus]
MDNLTARRSLTTEQQLMVNAEFEKRKRSKLIAYLLWIFFGIIGGHRFYCGDNGIAIGMIVVCAISWFLMFIPITVWAIIDVFLIGKRIDKLNEQLETTIIQKVKMINIVTTT